MFFAHVSFGTFNYIISDGFLNIRLQPNKSNPENSYLEKQQARIDSTYQLLKPLRLPLHSGHQRPRKSHRISRHDEARHIVLRSRRFFLYTLPPCLSFSLHPSRPFLLSAAEVENIADFPRPPPPLGVEISKCPGVYNKGVSIRARSLRSAVGFSYANLAGGHPLGLFLQILRSPLRPCHFSLYRRLFSLRSLFSLSLSLSLSFRG